MIRMIVSLILMALVCAFLTIGLNLHASTNQNLAAIYRNYEVIAVPNFQAYVTKRGELATAGNQAGYWPCEANEYDLTPIVQATGVESIDVRNRFGAFVGNEGFERDFTYSGSKRLEYSDVIRFRYVGDTTYRLSSGQSNMPPIKIQVTWSAAGIPAENYPTTITFDFKIDADIVLESGTEYIAVLGSRKYSYGRSINTIKVKSLWFGTSEYYKRLNPVYDNGVEWEVSYNNSFEPIAKYTDDFWNTEQGAFFKNAARACYYNLRSVNAVTTSDLTSMLPFHKGNLSVIEGRVFSEEEYNNGAQVCIVSNYLAQLNGWSIGDQIALSFYETEYPYSNSNTAYVPRYAEPVEGFFEEGTYEIVGLYDGLVTTDLWGNAIHYTEAIGSLFIDVYLPKKSVQNAPAPKLSENNVSIRLDPLSGQAFLAEMSDSGLMEKKNEGYQLGLTLYDQGLSAMAGGLEQLSDVSTLMVALSAAAAVLVVIVVIVFHVWQSKKEIASLRSLGVRKWQVLVIILSSLLLVSAVGCAIGSFCGHITSQWVAERIVATSNKDLGDMSFTAGSSTDQVWTKLKDFQFEGSQIWSVAVFSGCVVLVATLCFGIVLVWLESRKPPLLQLGRKE